MKKKLHFIFFSFISIIAYPQDDTYSGDPIHRKKKAEDVKCRYLTEKIDKFTGDIHILSYAPRPVVYSKLITKDGRVLMSIHLSGEGRKPIISTTPVKILLEDGSLIERKNASLNTEVTSGLGYTYSATFTLTQNEIDRLMNLLITDYRIEHSDTELPPRQRILAREAAICIFNQKDKPNSAIPEE